VLGRHPLRSEPARPQCAGLDERQAVLKQCGAQLAAGTDREAAQGERKLRAPQLRARRLENERHALAVPAIEATPARLVPCEVEMAIRAPFGLEDGAAFAAADAVGSA